MRDTDMLGPWVRRFLLEYLVGERNFASNTQRSYRDTLCLLIPFLAATTKATVDRLTISHATADSIRRFLSHLESTRHCGVATRNQRLAALHSLARYIGERSPEHLPWCTDVCRIPFKRAMRDAVCYLEKPEMDALLDAPDRTTRQGFRDYAVLLFLYNSGARATEVANVTIGDLDLSGYASRLSPTPGQGIESAAVSTVDEHSDGPEHADRRSAGDGAGLRQPTRSCDDAIRCA